AAFFFARLAEEAAEPVLRRLLDAFSRDEFRHTQAIADVLQRRVQRDPALVEPVLEAALHFTHYGAEAVDVGPTAAGPDLTAASSRARPPGRHGLQPPGGAGVWPQSGGVQEARRRRPPAAARGAQPGVNRAERG